MSRGPTRSSSLANLASFLRPFQIPPQDDDSYTMSGALPVYPEDAQGNPIERFGEAFPNKIRSNSVSDMQSAARTPLETLQQQAGGARALLQQVENMVKTQRMAGNGDERRDASKLTDYLGLLFDAGRTVDEYGEGPAAARGGRASRVTGQKRILADVYSEETEDSYDAPPRTKRPRTKLPVVDLAKLAPQPVQISYEAHPVEDRTDEWFTAKFNDLWRELEALADTFFAVPNIEAEGDLEPWGIPMAAEFYNWAEHVAEADEATGGWNQLLVKTRQRKWFVMAIIMRILRVKIFDIDLWGANKQQEESLHSFERAMFTSEGFTRTALRCTTVRSFLGQSPVTENFYEEVASLTARISLLLKPFSDFLYAQAPTHGEMEPRMEKQYQKIHNVVSNAAYLSICIRVSPKIFYYYDISPGEPYNPDDQLDVEPRIFQASKIKVFEQSRVWAARCRPMEKLVRKLGRERKEHSAEGRSVNEKYAALLQERPEQPDQTHRAMTMISVWPVITSYKAGSDKDDKDESEGVKRALADKDGFRILNIAKAAVVSYYGRQKKEEDWVVDLKEFAMEKRRQAGEGRVGRIAGHVGTVAAVGAAALALSLGAKLPLSNIAAFRVEDLAEMVKFVGNMAKI